MRVVKSCILFVLLICVLCACSDNLADNADEAGNSGRKTLTVWGWGDFNANAIETAKNYYARIDPDIDVIFETMTQNEIISKLSIAFSARDYDGLPDIALVEDYSIQSFLRQFPGELRPMPGNVNASDFMEFKIRALTYDGSVYGVPFDSGVAVLFYRSDYIAEAGYSTEDMNELTWDKFIEIGEAVREKTGKAMMSIAPSEIEQIRLMMHSAGKWYVEDDGKTVNLVNNDALKAAIRTYIRLIDSGIAMQVADYTYKTNDLVDGVVATMPGGCWRVNQLIPISDQSGKWAVTKIPRMSEIESSVNFASIGGSSWHIIDKSPGADLADDFLTSTFGSNIEMMNELGGRINAVSTLKTAGSQPNYARNDEFFGGQQILKDFFDWSLRVPPVDYGTNTFAIEKIVQEAVQSILQGADIDEALAIAQVKAEAAD